MKNPAHPGRIIRSDMDALGLSIEEMAVKLQVTPGELLRVIDGEAGVNDAMAASLGELFGNGTDMWLRLQAAYDAAQERNQELTPAENRD